MEVCARLGRAFLSYTLDGQKEMTWTEQPGRSGYQLSLWYDRRRP